MLAIGSTVLLTLTGHADSVTGNYINDAVVVAAVLDGSTTLFSTTLAYVASSNGNYQGTFTAVQTATLTPGKSYTIEYTATSSGGVLKVRDEVVANYV